MGVAHALLGQPVDVRRDRIVVAVATECGAHVLGGEPEDVGTIGGGEWAANRAEDEKDRKRTEHERLECLHQEQTFRTP